MVAEKIQRNAATPKGILRRTRDADFEQVDDPRNPNRIKHPLDGVLELAVVGLATNSSSQEMVETRSYHLAEEVDEAINLEDGISDNAFGLLLRRFPTYGVRQSLHRFIKAEWTGRENLRPTCLTKSTVAIDGKHLATLTECELRRRVDGETDLDGDDLTVEQLRKVYESRFPEVQIRVHDEEDDDADAGDEADASEEETDGEEAGETTIDGLIRVHRATLVSSEAAVVIDQRSIPGSTNEEGAIVPMVRSLGETYGRMDIAERVTVDAGNATKEAAAAIRSNGSHYFMAIKEPQGAIYERARRKLGDREGRQADFTHTEDRNGKTVAYTVWKTPVGEETHGWTDARQLVRVERVTIDNEGNETVGNRYFVTSEPATELVGREAYELSRKHWRCENEGHWTCDAIWDEDARRTPWTKHPTGIVNVGILRVLAIDILAILRSMSRVRNGDQLEKPTWQDVIEYAVSALVVPHLETGDFNAVDI